MARSIPGLNVQQKRFVDAFQKLTYKHQSWQVWSDFITMSACALSNRVDNRNYKKRESIYMDAIKRYDERERTVFPELFASVVDALNDNPEQDFLGVLFQLLELSSHWHGQFFTPYSVCRMMADMQMGGMTGIVEEKGYVSVNDPSCGAGALLIAFANAAKSLDVNYQNHVLFVAQDIDHTAALMCYIQLSLIGCPGYVIVGDTLRNPGITADNEVWYTPFYFSDVWHWRRLFNVMDKMMPSRVEKNEPVPEMKPEPRGLPTIAKKREETTETKELFQLTLF
jgi:hypothetical protein